MAGQSRNAQLARGLRAVTDRSHIDAYPQGGENHRHGGHDMIDAPGGPVRVRPHIREGYPVRGYTRSRPVQ